MEEHTAGTTVGTDLSCPLHHDTDPASPTVEDDISRIIRKDARTFEIFPETRSFIRPYIPGELAVTPMPENMSLKQITHVLVKRGDIRNARIPLLLEQADAYIYTRGEFMLNGTLTSIEQLKERLAKEPVEQFILPQDSDQLRISAVATGLYAVLGDYPNLLEGKALEDHAIRICVLNKQIWPQCTKDYPAYRQVFVEAFMLGYCLGTKDFINTPTAEQAKIIRSIGLPDQPIHPMILQLYVGMLKSWMQEVSATTVYDLAGV